VRAADEADPRRRRAVLRLEQRLHDLARRGELRSPDGFGVGRGGGVDEGEHLAQRGGDAALAEAVVVEHAVELPERAEVEHEGADVLTL